MRERLKKTTAIILGVILVMTLIQTPMDVRAADPITVSGTETITSEELGDYVVPTGATLVIGDGGIVRGTITITGTGILRIESGGHGSGDITVEDTGQLVNHGNTYIVRGHGGTIYNYGKIGNSITLSNGVSLTNEGIVYNVSAYSGSTVENKSGGSIDWLMPRGATIINSGTVKKELSVFGTGSMITLKAGSEIEKLSLTSDLTKLTSEEGAKINNATINTEYLDAGSSGTVQITDSLNLDGSADFPLTAEVSSSTKITNSSGYSGWSVNYNEKSYILPASTFEAITLSDMYSAVVSDSSITLPDLTVQYAVTDITEKTFTISNTGAFKMRWEIVSIPDFIELYDATGAPLSNGDAITLAGSKDGSASQEITVKAKTDLGADTYDYSIFSNICTAEGATNTLVSEENIAVTLNVNRKPGSGTVTVDDVYYGTPVSYTASSDTNDDGQIIEFKQRDASDDTYSTEAPTQAGEYTARATFYMTDIYEKFMAYADFAIFRKTGTGTISVSDIYYGETLNPTVSSSTNGVDAVMIQYKQKGAADDTYTTTVPKKAGEYTAQATFAQTEEYLAVVDTDDFKILRKTGAGTITVDDIYYGETLNPVVASEKNGTANVTIEYKKKGAPDSSYTTAKPTKAGDYTVRAIFAQTDEFLKATATDDFAILRKAGAGTITVADICYGVPVNPVVASDKNGTANVTIEYKKKGTPDDAYSQTKPNIVGDYTVRATFAQTDEFLEATATDDFVISYLKAPESPYTISGKMGNNDYYISVVTITPAEGYLIADSLDGTYRENLTVGQSAEEFNIYLKKDSTGEKTADIAVSAIKVDREAPVILNVKNGEKMYGEQVEITVKDDNLARVLVNGEVAEIENHMAILQLSSNLGEETYQITCMDVAGNTSKAKVVVAADWMKERTIPLGSKVRLSTRYSYQLGGGIWQVQGDGTSYAGDTTFYVSNDGEYIFTKVD